MTNPNHSYVPFSFEDAAGMVNEGLSDLKLPTAPARLYDPIRYVLSGGGKRVRSSLVLAACSLFSNKPRQAMPAALAVEVFHNFTLVHDDIMDHAPVRRNKPTVHRKWNRNIAILSGDVMSVLAYHLLTGVPSRWLIPVLRIFNKTAMEVCEGQQMDMDFENNREISEEKYIRMISLKTGSLLAASLQMGAVLGGSSASDADALHAFGLNLGISFQLRDDWLDVFGDPEKFGKKTGGDILSDKKTFLLIKAMELARGSVREELHFLIGNKKMPAKEKVGRMKDIYLKLNIGGITREKMEIYYRKASASLEKVSVPEQKKRILKKFAGDLMEREN